MFLYKNGEFLLFGPWRERWASSTYVKLAEGALLNIRTFSVEA